MICCTRAGNIIPSKSINFLAKLILHLYLTPLLYTPNIQVPTTSLPVSSDSSAFSIANKMYPLPSRPPVKKTKKTEYFVITADEVIHQKKEAAAFKIKQEEIKQQKRLERERKRSEKIIKKATKTNPKKGHTDLQDLL